MSFTITLRDPSFFDFMERFTGNAAGTGDLVTFRDSSWLMSGCCCRCWVKTLGAARRAKRASASPPGVRRRSLKPGGAP
jgi:hypothetical protein